MACALQTARFNLHCEVGQDEKFSDKENPWMLS